MRPRSAKNSAGSPPALATSALSAKTRTRRSIAPFPCRSSRRGGVFTCKSLGLVFRELIDMIDVYSHDVALFYKMMIFRTNPVA